MIRTTLAFSLALVLAASSNAAIIISGNTSGVDTPGVAGAKTFNITATSETATDKIIGFDFVGGGGTYGVTGAFGQVNPASLPTVFNDNNALFGLVGAQVAQDTQFTVKSTDGIAITPSESAGSLKAAFSYLPAAAAAATNSLAFLQAVLTQGTGHALGTLTVRNAAGEDRLETVNFDIGAVIPEPATIGLLGLALVGFCGIRRR